MGMMEVTQKGLLLRTQLQDQTNKCCVDCNTTKTPLWRGGPAGPKSLCNACGIRFRKRRISTNRGYVRKKERPNSSTAMGAVSATTSSSSGTTAINTTTSGGGSGDGEEDLGECRSLRMRVMMPFREEVVVVQNASSVQKQGKLGEEEQAAVLLMALSCGSVFA
ncbi:GATA transcription factor 16-like [Cucurbita moschata]|uniref:GATA transcription factor 16-like n=1 Tax=Cucurbita moschata TaxID=3662 RepID=A0A6J1F048_CUCMO|nr:GATA transcription factor 16-like [Cucurbita moschata]